jgi:predicted lipoprotein with Yx(FWY)xxD motif
MKSSLIWLIIIALVILGGWYWYMTQTLSTPTDELSNDELSGGVMPDDIGMMETGDILGPVLNVANDATLGEYLVASNGMTLYLYTKDEDGVSNCTDTCAENWPPYTVAGNEDLEGGEGVTGEIGALRREDASIQLTYNGAPIYFWKDDARPGDTTGNNVNDVWYVVKP